MGLRSEVEGPVRALAEEVIRVTPPCGQQTDPPRMEAPQSCCPWVTHCVLHRV